MKGTAEETPAWEAFAPNPSHPTHHRGEPPGSTASNDDGGAPLRAMSRTCVHCRLRSQCLPAGLRPEALAELDRIVRARPPLKKGESLFNVGDPFHSIYIVRTGAVRTSVPNGDGDEQVVAFNLPGEPVGIESIGEDQHVCRAVALERTSVCTIPFDTLLNLSHRWPELEARVHRLFSRGMLQHHEHFRAMGRRTARQRLIMFLSDLLSRYRAAGFGADQMRLPMYRDDIANYLGVALETVSRMMSRLADEGVIEVKHRHVRIVEDRVTALASGAASVAPAQAARQ